MKPAALAACILATMVIAASNAHAQRSPPPFQGPALAADRVLAPAVDILEVTSPAFPPGGRIPVVHSGYGKGLSFPLAWTPGPPATRAYAVIVEDPDDGQPQPTLHWLAFNIPASETSIGRNVRNRAVVLGAKGMIQGLNSKGGIGYIGPHPKAGDPPHHYHVQVFALSRMLKLGGGATLDQVLIAMHEHVLAEGELIGTFQAPDPKAPRTAKAP